MFERFRRKDALGGPEVAVLVAPNGIAHKYSTGVELPPLTTTPHTELLGANMSHVYHERPMDEETRTLYDAVRALDGRITSVSIHPHKLDVEGPMRTIRGNYIRGDWPKGLDLEVVHVMANHLGLDGIHMTLRQQTEDELWAHMDSIIAGAVAEGAKPPEGWPYRHRY